MRFALALICLGSIVCPGPTPVRAGPASAGGIDEFQAYLPPEFWQYRELFLPADARIELAGEPPAEAMPSDCSREDETAEESGENPLDARGSIVVSFRYESADDSNEARSEDTWVFLPSRRSAPPIREAARDEFERESFALGELRSFNAIPSSDAPACADTVRVITPSTAEHEWELRDAWLLRFELEPYGREEVYVDRETFAPLYSFAYDRANELWRITWHAGDSTEVTVDVQTRRKLQRLPDRER